MFKEIALVFMRNFMVALRNPAHVIIGLFQPFCFLLLFAPLLKSLSPFAGNHLTVYTPGLLIMLAFYGSSFVGFSLIDDWRTGFLERLWVSPVSRTAIIIGRTLRDIVVVLFQAIFLIALSFAFGMEASLTGILISLGLVILIAAILSSVSYIIALIFKEESALAATINLFLVPIQLLSGITLPLALAPQWIQTLAFANPLAHAVDATRALFVGQFGNMSVFLSFGLLAVLSFVSIKMLIGLYNKRAVA